MGCVSTAYTREELDSIFLWDAICDILPMTVEEIRESAERDREFTLLNANRKTGKETRKPETQEQIQRVKQQKAEAQKRWRDANQEHLREYRRKYKKELRERKRAEKLMPLDY